MTYRPPHNAVPGSTAYFTIPNIGGFYAPVSRNEPMRRRVDDDSDHDDGDEHNNHASRAAMSMQQQPTYGHPSYMQQQHPQMHPYEPATALPPQPWNYPGAAMPTRAMAHGQPQGRVFTGWKGVPEEKKNNDAKDIKDKDKAGSQNDAKDKKDSKSKNRKSGYEPVSPWQQLSDRLRTRSEKHRRRSRAANDDSDAECAYDYDVCDTPVRRGRNHSPLDQVTFSESADVKVIIQPYGSARVIVHIDEHGDSGYGFNEGDYGRHDRNRSNEKMVAFVVSDRCLSMAAKEWPHQCHPGTRTCNIRVSCDEAVIGMYWMLHVLHHAGRDSTIQSSLTGQQRDRQFQQQVALQRYLKQRAMTHPQGEREDEDEDEVEDGNRENRHGRKKRVTDHFVYDYYHGSVGTRAVPIELPPRVLAFALMFAVQFGVVDAWRPSHPPNASRVPASLQATAWAQAQTGPGKDKGMPQSLAAVPDPSAPAPAPAPSAFPTAAPVNSDSPVREAFRLAANQWLQSIASTQVNMTMGRLNSITVPPDEVLFVLYAGRVLGCPTLLRLCQLTILDRWSIDDMGNWFRDGSGHPVCAGEILPPHMAETVSMDLFSLKSAHDRSLTKVADLATRLLGGQ